MTYTHSLPLPTPFTFPHRSSHQQPLRHCKTSAATTGLTACLACFLEAACSNVVEEGSNVQRTISKTLLACVFLFRLFTFTFALDLLSFFSSLRPPYSSLPPSPSLSLSAVSSHHGACLANGQPELFSGRHSTSRPPPSIPPSSPLPHPLSKEAIPHQFAPVEKEKTK